MPTEDTTPPTAHEQLHADILAALDADNPAEALALLDAAQPYLDALNLAHKRNILATAAGFDHLNAKQLGEIRAALVEAAEAARPRLHPLERPDPLPLAPDWLLASPDKRPEVSDPDRMVGWLPDARLAALSGDGALGKSHVAVALAAAVAGGGDGTRPFCQRADKDKQAVRDKQAAKRFEESAKRYEQAALRICGAKAPAIVATWEDDAAECWRRVHALAKGGFEWASPDALGDRLRFVRPEGPVWSAREKGNAAALAVLTPTGEALLHAAAEAEARLLVVDPVAAAFGASEIDRAQVRAFCAALDAWSRDTGCAVLLVQHPSKTERPTGGQSGSTDWRNAPRAVLTLTLEANPAEQEDDGNPKRNLPTLTCNKSNYGRRPDPVALSRETGAGGMHWLENPPPAKKDGKDGNGGGDDGRIA